MFPISDAGLGALAYMIEALSGFMGGRDRWRTMPWMVLLFGLLVIPLGIVSIVLVVLQPLAVGTFCTACLATGVLMLVMIPFAADEVVAMGQFLADVRRRGDSVWTNFWRGGTMNGDPAVDDASAFPAPLSVAARSATRGVSAARTLLAALVLGVLLMFAPAIYGVDGAAAESNWLFGPLVITFSAIALADVTRALRLVNVPFAAWVVASPWVLGDLDVAFALATSLMGLAVLGLSLQRGAVGERYAAWNRFVR